MDAKLFLLICAFAVGAMAHTYIDLDEEFNVMFHMTTVPNRIEIQVMAKTTGWVGFGFSNANSSINADMVIGGVDDTTLELYHKDYFSTSATAFPTEDVQQNWFRNDTQCRQNGTHTTMYYYRLLDTGDATQDLVIPDSNVYLIWAYGASDELVAAERQVIYQTQVNLVSSGSHDSGSSVIHGSVAIILLLCAGLYALH